jgi:two-component system sensor histidine kinase/response regulator
MSLREQPRRNASPSGVIFIHAQVWETVTRGDTGEMTRSILVVDDDPRNVALLVSMLEELREEVVTAGGGREALARIGERAPDLVLLDLEMPGLDGIDVLTHLRAGDGAHIPVIVVTAHGEREQRLRALNAGADEFLEKPIDRAILHARVKTLLALKSSRDELAAQHASLLSLQREQREMMQFIVHDLRTPLMVVQTSLTYAGDALTSDPKEALEALRDASESIIRVNDLVTDVLSVSRLEQAQMPLDRSRVELDPLVARLTGLYSRKAKARRIEIAAHIDRVVLRADAALLRRVLENILDNSLRHTPLDGKVGVDASRAGSHVRIAISNSGPPVPQGERSAIFEKFQRGTSPGSRPGAVGLGLYFCKRVVEAHGGQIHVEDTPLWPTSFVIDLPAD